MTLLADVPVRLKFLLLPGIAALLMLALGAIYAVGYREASTLQQRIDTAQVPLMHELSRRFSELSTNHLQFVSLLAASFSAGAQPGQFYASGRKHILAANRTLDELAALEPRLSEADGSRPALQRLRQRLVGYRDRMAETVLQASVRMDQIAIHTLPANQAYDAVNSDFLALIDIVQGSIGRDSQALQAALRRARLTFYAALGLTLLLIGAASLLLSRAFGRDLTALMRKLGRLAAGDTGEPQPAGPRRDEFGAVDQAVQTLREALLQRDAAEQRLRQAVEASQTGILDHDLAGGTLYWSPEMRAHFGLAPDEPVSPQRYLELTLPQDRAQVAAALAAAADPQGDGVFALEHRILRPDGSVRWLLIRSRTVFEGAGARRRALRSVGAARDITERMQAAQELQQLNEQLEQRVQLRTAELSRAKDEAERASQAKSEFLSRMSHELRTPLNAVLGFGQLLELQPLEPRQAGHVTEILRAGRHLLELIDDVLDLARVESGRLMLSPEPVALLGLIEDCLALLRPQAEAQGVRLLDAARHCNVHVRADRTRLRQVLLNLLSNAIKYNRPHGTVNVVCADEGDTVLVRITDTGPGLTPQQQARLFVPFERLDADERRIQGTGIGLALSKRLVELLGGTLGVESSPGAGSSFWVRLPRAAATADPAAPQPAPLPPAPIAGRPRADLLCIEDNPANLRLIEGIFEARSDLRLLGAMAPGMGLDLARTLRPALILLDIHLPDMDGYAVMQCLREHEATRDIPVVAISANAMPKDIERAKAAGFRAYLTKPLDVTRLVQVVDELLAQRPGAAP